MDDKALLSLLGKKNYEKFKGNEKWWAERQAEEQQKLTEKNIADTEKQLRKYYKTAMENTVGQFEKTYTHILSSMEEGREPTPADLYKLDTYWKMQGQLTQELTKLGDKQAALFSKKFMDEYTHIYKAFAIKDDLFFGDIDKGVAEQLINAIWCADGKTWSSRIWTNTKYLQETLNETLLDCLITGRKPADLKKELMQRFTVSFSNADSIVRTEMAHIQTEAAKQRYKDAGVEMVEVWADKDERRCDICGKLHQTKHPINGTMPIPAHPRCRCCILPVIN
jgi:SPP1 gp7 family putative phage head morphogenesis protein